MLPLILNKTLISHVIQVLLDVVNFGMPLKDAVTSYRLHHQLLPDILFAEVGFSADILQALKDVGHDVELRSTGAVVQAIHVGDDGLIHAVSDPRKGGQPSGY